MNNSKKNLNLQCSSKSTKEQIEGISKEVETINKKIKDLSIKMENSNTMLKLEMTNDVCEFFNIDNENY